MRRRLGVGTGFSHYSHGYRRYEARYIDKGTKDKGEKKEENQLIRGKGGEYGAHVARS